MPAHFFQKLSEGERQSLTDAYALAQDKTIASYFQTVLLHDQGYSETQLSKLLLLQESVIRRHLCRYAVQREQGGENNKNRAGLTDITEIHQDYTGQMDQTPHGQHQEGHANARHCPYTYCGTYHPYHNF